MRSAVNVTVPLATVLSDVGFAVFVTLIFGFTLVNVTTASSLAVAVVLSSSLTVAVTVFFCVVPVLPESGLINEHE